MHVWQMALGKPLMAGLLASMGWATAVVSGTLAADGLAQPNHAPMQVIGQMAESESP